MSGHKALTFHQPWATLIALGVKTIETRSWSTSYRGPLAIHAAKRPSKQEWDTDEWSIRYDHVAHYPTVRQMSPERRLLGSLFPDDVVGHYPLPLGAVVAVADLTDCLPILSDAEDHIAEPFIEHDSHGFLTRFAPADTEDSWGSLDDQRPYGDFTPGRFGWVLENVVALPEPVPATGRQGLWNWDGGL